MWRTGGFCCALWLSRQNQPFQEVTAQQWLLCKLCNATIIKGILRRLLQLYPLHPLFDTRHLICLLSFHTSSVQFCTSNSMTSTSMLNMVHVKSSSCSIVLVLMLQCIMSCYIHKCSPLLCLCVHKWWPLCPDAASKEWWPSFVWTAELIEAKKTVRKFLLYQAVH